MKKIIQSVFASCLGVMIAFFIMGILGLIVLFGMLNSQKQIVDIKPATVLHLKLSKPLPEKTNNVEMDPLQLQWQNNDIIGLQDLLYVLEKAKEDDRIKGIFLDTESVSMGFSTIRALRMAINDFKEEGKFVIAHANYLSQGAYYLATVADSIYLNPGAMIDLRGLSAKIFYYKEGLEKAGVSMEVFYAGKFKSATEPYRRDNMSSENRYQIRSYLNEINGHFLEDIAESRDITVSQLRKSIDNWDASIPELSLEGGLVDVIGYEDEAIDLMRKKLGLEAKAKVPVISPEKYFLAQLPPKVSNAKEEIALVFVEGGFIGGGETAGAVAEKHYVRMLRQIRRDKDVKAIVLRVNSGGGSTMTSENIWRELMLAKTVDSLPVVVSMGSTAASAAYMISALADSIFAEETTLTGSIGVFGIQPTIQKLLNNRLGIHIDTVLTGKLSGGLEYYYSFSDKERRILQNGVNIAYDNFLQKVSEGRGKTKEEINEIGQGRVWTGTQAVKIGLVDRIGNLQTALQAAATLAEIEEYRLSEFPEIKNPMQQILDEIMNPAQAKSRQQRAFLKDQLGSLYPYFEFLHESSIAKGPQARLPFFISLD